MEEQVPAGAAEKEIGLRFIASIQPESFNEIAGQVVVRSFRVLPHPQNQDQDPLPSNAASSSAPTAAAGREYFVLFCQSIPPEFYSAIAKLAAQQNMMGPSDTPKKNPPTISLGMKVLIYGGCITAAASLFLFFLRKSDSKQEMSTSDNLLKSRSTRASMSFMGKMVMKVLKEVGKEIATKVLETLEKDED